MNLDFPGAIQDLQTERVVIQGRRESVYCHVIIAGDPVSGGSLNARQDGDQYTLRFLKKDYLAPKVHDRLKTTNYGTLSMKQSFNEGEFWACLCTGTVRGRHSA